MCGIAGLLDLSLADLPASASSAVKRMTDAMRHRGPDGEGVWQQGPICFGHRRLSIIDLAGGTQPMHDASGNYCIVFNGEIYNFKELRNELENAGARFLTSSDTEVILNAFAFWGESCLDRLEGMFAFALWDTRKKSLFCARDHFGKKPFYYTLQNGIFAFASDLTALTTLQNWDAGNFSFNLSHASLLRYLAYEYVPTPDAIYTEVSVLPPAHKLVSSGNTLRTERYWDLPIPLDKIAKSERELEEELFELMERAVKMRMVSDVPLGVFLSGGIDSTIVAGLMAANSSRPIKTFSIGFKEASYDESRYARMAAAAYGADACERILSADECADQLPGIAAALDTPMADASCAPTWLLSALTREQVTVALGGDGADELWAGYEHYIGYKIALAYNRLPHILREYAIPVLADLLPESAGYINPRLALKTFLKGAAAPDWLRVQSMLSAMEPSMIRSVLSAEWLESYSQTLLPENLFASTKLQFEHWSGEFAASSLARAFHVYCRQFLLDDILVKVDRCSMLHSLEVRAPFLDKKVSEFAAKLPITYKLHGFKRKYLLKKAFARILPKEILHRNKRGFQIPVAAWLRGKLKPLLLEMADPARLRREGIFNPAGIHKLIELHLSEKKDLRKPLWTFLVLQLWLQART